MIKLIIYILITFFLDNLFNNLEIKELFFPQFIVSSLIILFIMLKDNKKYLILTLILGFIYDILYNNIPYNIFIFLIIGLVIISYYKFFKISFINTILLTTIIIFIYNFLIFLISVIYLNNDYTTSIFINKFINSILLNIVYNALSYFIFCHNKSYYLSKKR